MTETRPVSTDAQTFHDGLARLFRENHVALGIADPIATLTTTTLGAGESNLSLRVEVNGRQSFTARLAYRAEAKADVNLAREFEQLTLLPAGVGPTPLYLDLSKRHVPYPCAVLSFVPGAPRAEWSVEDVRAYAATLARLHRPQVPHWGAIGDAHERPFDMRQRFHDSLAYWRTHHPALLEIDTVARLVLRLDAYTAAHNSLFTGLSSFSLVHGDPCVPNVLFDHNGEVRYIDWEWMGYGDPALDVAQLGWDIANPPWQIALVGDRLDAYLGAYQAHRPDPTLRERREVWMAHLKFFDHLHYRTKAQQHQTEANNVSRKHYLSAVERIADSLIAQFFS